MALKKSQDEIIQYYLDHPELKPNIIILGKIYGMNFVMIRYSHMYT